MNKPENNNSAGKDNSGTVLMPGDEERGAIKGNQVAPSGGTVEKGKENKEEKKGFLGRMGEGIGKGYDATKAGVTKFATRAKEEMNTLGKDISAKANQNEFVKKYGIEMYEDVRNKLQILRQDIKNEILTNTYFQSIKFRLNKFVILKLEKIIDKQLENLAEIIKKETDDPDMCGCVKRLKDDLIDEFYPDLREEIMFILRTKISQPYIEFKEPEKLCCLVAAMRGSRAWILYTLDPVDMTIWKRIKTFSFWILQIIQLFPLYGVQTFFLLLYFLLMCKVDEYQLVNYIVSFKKLQFFTIGCLGGLIAYIQYFFCILTSRGSADIYGEVNRCAAKSGQDAITYWIEVGTFFLKIVLVWAAYMLLPCSKKLGQPSFRIMHASVQQNIEEDHKKCFNCARGGSRLRKLMIWELFASIFTVAVFLVIYFLLINRDQISMREVVKFCQILYGLLSFPFLIFSLPLMTTMLTKSRPTRYDSYGRCVPDLPTLYSLKEREQRAEQQRVKERAGRGKGNDDEDVRGLLSDDKADIFAELDKEEVGGKDGWEEFGENRVKEMKELAGLVPPQPRK